jgi:hypothetical protein
VQRATAQSKTGIFRDFGVAESQVKLLITYNSVCIVQRATAQSKREHLTRLSAPWTNSRPHPQIANQLAGGNKFNANLLETVVLRQHGEGAVIARCRELFTTILYAFNSGQHFYIRCHFISV